MLSQTTEYALRAIVCLAAEPDRPQTNQQLAERTQAPAGYMAKVVQELNKAGLVTSQRGPHGGSILSRNPAQISMLDVINAIEPIGRIERCPLGLPSHMALCPLHRRVDEAMAHVQKAFATTTIAELLAEKSASKPLCDASTPVTIKTSARSKSRKRSRD